MISIKGMPTKKEMRKNTTDSVARTKANAKRANQARSCSQAVATMNSSIIRKGCAQKGRFSGCSKWKTEAQGDELKELLDSTVLAPNNEEINGNCKNKIKSNINKAIKKLTKPKSLKLKF